MIIYRAGNYKKFTNQVEGKKVLILGSGPSARDVDWKNVDFDLLLTTSFFYLNNDVVSMKPRHVSLSKLVDLKNPVLNKFLEDNPDCTVSFEPKIHRVKSYAGSCGHPSLSIYPSFKQFFEYFDITDENNDDLFFQCFQQIHKFYGSSDFRLFFKKFRHQILFFRAEGGLEGLAGRIIWPVFDSKPSKIYLCGVDGFSKDWTKDPKNYFRSHQGTPDKHYTHSDFKKSFQSYGKKIYSTSKISKIPVVNLGKGFDYNLITPISEMYE